MLNIQMFYILIDAAFLTLSTFEDFLEIKNNPGDFKDWELVCVFENVKYFIRE